MTWLDVTSEQRKSARTWALIGAGPAVLAVIIFIIIALVWVIRGSEALRIHWLGTLGLALAGLLAIPLATFGVDQALRLLKIGASRDGVTIEAAGRDAPEEPQP